MYGKLKRLLRRKSRKGINTIDRSAVDEVFDIESSISSVVSNFVPLPEFQTPQPQATLTHFSTIAEVHYSESNTRTSNLPKLTISESEILPTLRESRLSPGSSSRYAHLPEFQTPQPQATLTHFSTIAEVHYSESDTRTSTLPKLTISESEILPALRESLQSRLSPGSSSRYARIAFGFEANGQSGTSESAERDVFERLAEIYHEFPALKTEVRIVMADQTIVYLLGTNHADPQCPMDVENIIKKVRPQAVVIELCAWRACGCPVHRGNVFQTRPQFSFRYLRRVINQIGFLPAMIFFTDAFNEHNAVTSELLDYGGEFAVAARLCEELSDCKVLLGDREIPITVKRQATGMGNWRAVQVCLFVTLSLIFKGQMKTLLLRAHRLVIKDPRFYQIVVLERDIFLTYMIQMAASMKYLVNNPHIVAVVGQGHLNGIQNFWGKILPQILPLILKPEIDF